MKFWLILLLIIVAVLGVLGVIYAPKLIFKVIKGVYKGTEFIGKKLYKGAKYIGRSVSNGVKNLNRHRKKTKPTSNFHEHNVSSIRHESNSPSNRNKEATVNVNVIVQGSSLKESDSWSDL